MVPFPSILGGGGEVDIFSFFSFSTCYIDLLEVARGGGGPRGYLGWDGVVVWGVGIHCCCKIEGRGGLGAAGPPKYVCGDP